MAGQRFLVPYVRVRLLPPQPLRFQSAYVAPSSSGLGRRPLKAEVEGSNPFGATKKQQARAFALAFFFSLRRLLAYRAKRGFSLPGSPLLHASSIEARGPRVGQLEKLEGRKASPRKSCLWGYRGKWVP